jgi:hypothetical protein
MWLRLGSIVRSVIIVPICTHAMENIPPPALSSSAMTVDDETRLLPTLDQLVTRSKPGRKSRRPVTRILSPRPNEDRESAVSPDFESGLLSPPPSQKVHAMNPSSMLISPPPEETIHKQGRTPVRYFSG